MKKKKLTKEQVYSKVTAEVRKRLRNFYGVPDPGELRVEFYDQDVTEDIPHEVIENKMIDEKK